VIKMIDCIIANKLGDENLYHKVEYKDEYYELSDDKVDRLTYEEERSFIKNPIEEDKWEENFRIRMGEHIKNCSNDHCKEVLEAWKNEESLRRFVI